MKTRRKRVGSKGKNVQKKKGSVAAAAAAPVSSSAVSPEHRSGMETLAAVTEIVTVPETVAASAPLTASGALHANKRAFLNLVGQIAQESLRLDKTSDAGIQGVCSGSHRLSSSPSSSSGSDDLFHVGDSNGGMVERGIDCRGDTSGRKRGRSAEGDVVKSGLHPWSSKEKRSRKSCHDPRYNDKELNICLGVIRRIMDMDEAASFITPVGPVPLESPNRIDIRMDFGTICSNLQNGFKYLNSDDVYKDVQCIWAHCLKYNKKGDYIVYLMKRVKKKFLKYWTSAGLRTEMQKSAGQHEFLPDNGHMTGHISVTPPSYSHHALVKPSSYSHHSQVPTSSYNHHVPPSSYSYQAQVLPSSYNHHSQVHPSSYNHQACVPSSSYIHQVHVPLSSYSHQAQRPPSSYSHQAQVPPSSYNHQAQVPPSCYIHKAPMPPSSYDNQARVPSSSYNHQTKSTRRYLRGRGRSPSRRKPSQTLVQGNDDARSPDGLAARSDLEQNGFMSSDAVNPIETTKSQQHLSRIPEENIGQPQHSERFASASHAEDMNGLRRGERQNGRCSDNYLVETATPSFQQLPAQHQHYDDHSSPGSPEEAVPISGKRIRGVSSRRSVWDMPDGSKIVVPLNDLGQAIGPDGRKLASFLGTLARDGNLAPVTHVHWSKVPKENKEHMWLMVQAKFEIDPVMGKSWVMKSLSTKWRNWKARLKADYYSYKTDEERMRNLDRRVLPDQWPILISYWNKEEVQLYAARQKANRANLKGGHTSGSKSYATLREEERAKRADGTAPTRAELYVLTHTRKDGNPVSEKAAEVIAKLQEKASARQQDSEASDSSRDTFCEVMGEEKNSHVRMCGLGPTPNTLYSRKCGHIQFAKMAMEAKKQADDEANKVYHKVEVMEQKYASMEAQIARVNENMELMLRKMGLPPVPSGSAHANQVDQEAGAQENSHQAEEEPRSAASSSSRGV